jgi:glycosyltransferase involved in cell wall biosynthesis
MTSVSRPSPRSEGGSMEKMTIIYFGNDWFAENKTSSHHIAERLAASHTLLYVECPGLRMPQGNKRDLKKLFAKVKKAFSPPQRVAGDVWIHTLFQIPLHKYALVRMLNEKLILFSLRRVMKRLKLSDPLLWFHLPHLSMVPGKLASKGTVYYCIDNYSAVQNVDQTAVQRMDDEMTRVSDIVFVSSRPLYDKKRGMAKRLVLSPHGVDFRHFHAASSGTLPAPRDVAAIPGPVIGFWGLIDNRIDLELIRFLATGNPQWNFVMIGHLGVESNPCAGLQNVHFLGPRRYDELPAMAQLFDVAILPYSQNDFVFHCNPIKLREYLSTGKPAVSTRFPEIEPYSDVIAVADGYQDFAAKIAAHLQNDCAELAAKRVARVKDDSWDRRVDEIVTILDGTFYGGER